MNHLADQHSIYTLRRSALRFTNPIFIGTISNETNLSVCFGRRHQRHHTHGTAPSHAHHRTATGHGWIFHTLSSSSFFVSWIEAPWNFVGSQHFQCVSVQTNTKFLKLSWRAQEQNFQCGVLVQGHLDNTEWWSSHNCYNAEIRKFLWSKRRKTQKVGTRIISVIIFVRPADIKSRRLTPARNQHLLIEPPGLDHLLFPSNREPIWGI